jgi:hypothetical protein
MFPTDAYVFGNGYYVLQNCRIIQYPAESLIRRFMHLTELDSGCLLVIVSVCLWICLSVCLSACLSVGLSACLSVGLFACLSVCLPTDLPACLSVCLSEYAWQ